MLDRVSLSILQLRLEAIVQEMGEAMLRTAYSQILNSSRDFSTAVCDGEGRLTAQAEHVPIHVGAMPWAVQSIREFFTGRIQPGDMFLLNDPYHGGNHLPDLTVLLPVFIGERLVFWSINRAHQRQTGPEPSLEARISSFELAFRMQDELPRVEDLSCESRSIV